MDSVICVTPALARNAHPAMFPVALCGGVYKSRAAYGLMFEPFSGSGLQSLCARKWVQLRGDGAFSQSTDIAVKRWQDFTARFTLESDWPHLSLKWWRRASARLMANPAHGPRRHQRKGRCGLKEGLDLTKNSGDDPSRCKVSTVGDRDRGRSDRGATGKSGRVWCRDCISGAVSKQSCGRRFFEATNGNKPLLQYGQRIGTPTCDSAELCSVALLFARDFSRQPQEERCHRSGSSAHGCGGKCVQRTRRT